jgi:hypothetical protein
VLDDESLDELQEIMTYKNKHNVTRQELAAAYLSLVYQNAIAKSALSNTIRLFNITSEIKLPITFNGLNQLISADNDNQTLKYQTRWYCSNCLQIKDAIESRTQRECKVCKKQFTKYFSLDIENQIRKIFESTNILNKRPNEKIINNNNNNNEFLNDITDGKLHLNMHRNIQDRLKEAYDYNDIYSFLINTDGISLSKVAN